MSVVRFNWLLSQSFNLLCFYQKCIEFHWNLHKYVLNKQLIGWNVYWGIITTYYQFSTLIHSHNRIEIQIIHLILQYWNICSHFQASHLTNLTVYSFVLH